MDDLIPIFVLFVTPVTLALLFIGYRLANRVLDLRMAKLNGESLDDAERDHEPLARPVNPQPIQERAKRLQERLSHLEEILAQPARQGER